MEILTAVGGVNDEPRGNLHGRFFKGAVELALGYAGQQGLQLLRNVLIARLIMPEDFGFVVTFAFVISAFQTLTDIGLEFYLIRAPSGQDPQASLQAFALMRGALVALGIFAAADFFAWIFSVPDLAWAYRWLAIVPLIKSFAHLDIRRYERQLSFRPGVVVGLFASALGTVTAIILAYFFSLTFEAMLWAYVAEALVSTIGSHFAAERPYRLSLVWGAVGASLFSFGWPLMLNGVLLFAGGQGDRFLLGSMLGLEDLANYSVAALLTGGAALFVLKVTGALYLPILSPRDMDARNYTRRFELSGTISTLASIGVMVPLVIAGPAIVTTLYGSKYNVPPLLFGVLSVMAGAEILRCSWLVTDSLAGGDTKGILYANMIGSLGVVGAFISLFMGFGIVAVGIAMCGGELFSGVFTVIRTLYYSVAKGNISAMFLAIFVATSATALTAQIYCANTLICQFIAICAILSLGFLGILFTAKEFRLWIGRWVPLFLAIDKK